MRSTISSQRSSLADKSRVRSRRVLIGPAHLEKCALVGPVDDAIIRRLRSGPKEQRREHVCYVDGIVALPPRRNATRVRASFTWSLVTGRRCWTTGSTAHGRRMSWRDWSPGEEVRWPPSFKIILNLRNR
jgi:hypothetical protein